MLTRLVRLVHGMVFGIIPAWFLLATVAKAQPPTITVTPDSAAPGEAVNLTGSGWPAGAAIVVRMVEAGAQGAPPSTVVATGTTDGNGNFTAQSTIPAELLGFGFVTRLTVVPGTYVLMASSGPDGSASTSLTVGAPQKGALLWGRVFRDANGDGAFDPGDALIFAQLAIDNLSQPEPVRRPFTDGRGFYGVSPVLPGSYRLSSQVEVDAVPWVGSVTAEAADRQAVQVNIPLRPTAATITPPTAPSALPKAGEAPMPLALLALAGAAAFVIGVSLRWRLR